MLRILDDLQMWYLSLTSPQNCQIPMQNLYNHISYRLFPLNHHQGKRASYSNSFLTSSDEKSVFRVPFPYGACTHTHTLGELCVENIEHTGMVDKWQNNTYSLDRARVFIPSECAAPKVHFISNHEKTEPQNQEQV